MRARAGLGLLPAGWWLRDVARAARVGCGVVWGPGVSGGVGPPPLSPSRAVRRAGWPKRRQWLDRISADRRLTSGAKSWLLLLASRSDDAGKPVWGNQVRMGERIGRCGRSMRRYRAEAEALGYVAVYRSKPERGPSGRWSRRKANAYYLRIPTPPAAGLPAPRRRQRASYCVASSHRSSTAPSPAAGHCPAPARTAADRPPDAPPSGGGGPGGEWVSVLADSDGRSSPLRGAPTGAAPAISHFPPTAERSDPFPTDRDHVAALIAELKASLRTPSH